MRNRWGRPSRAADGHSLPPSRCSRLLSCWALALVREAACARAASVGSFRRISGAATLNKVGSQEQRVAGRGPNFQDVEEFDLPVCDCDCCVVSERKLDEIHPATGALLKCALDEGGTGGPVVKRVPSGTPGEEMAVQYQCPGPSKWESKRCNLASTGMHAKIFPTVLAHSSPAGTDYNRFCFYQCQPPNFILGDPCQAIDVVAARASMTAHGNGRDIGLQPASAGASPLTRAPDFDKAFPTGVLTTTTPVNTPPPLGADVLQAARGIVEGRGALSATASTDSAEYVGSMADRVMSSAKAAAQRDALAAQLLAPAPATAPAPAAAGADAGGLGALLPPPPSLPSLPDLGLLPPPMGSMMPRLPTAAGLVQLRAARQLLVPPTGPVPLERGPGAEEAPAAAGSEAKRARSMADLWAGSRAGSPAAEPGLGGGGGQPANVTVPLPASGPLAEAAALASEGAPTRGDVGGVAFRPSFELSQPEHFGLGPVSPVNLAQLRSDPLGTLKAILAQRFADILDESIDQFPFLVGAL